MYDNTQTNAQAFRLTWYDCLTGQIEEDRDHPIDTIQLVPLDVGGPGLQLGPDL